MFLRRGEQFLPRMEAVVASGASPRDQLHSLVDEQVGFFREHPHFGRLYLHAAGTVHPGPEVPESEALADNFARAMEIQADIFRRGQRRKELRSGDPVVLARLLSGLIFGFQSLDPAVVADGDASERLPLTALHEIVDGAFAR